MTEDGDPDPGVFGGPDGEVDNELTSCTTCGDVHPASAMAAAGDKTIYTETPDGEEAVAAVIREYVCSEECAVGKLVQEAGDLGVDSVGVSDAERRGGDGS